MVAAIKDVVNGRDDGQPLTCPSLSVSRDFAESDAAGNARKVSPRGAKYRLGFLVLGHWRSCRQMPQHLSQHKIDVINLLQCYEVTSTFHRTPGHDIPQAFFILRTFSNVRLISSIPSTLYELQIC